MDSNSTVVYINDEQFTQLLNALNEKNVHSEVAQDSQYSSVSNSSDSSLSEVDILSYMLLAEFIIIGILAWALVRGK